MPYPYRHTHSHRLKHTHTHTHTHTYTQSLTQAREHRDMHKNVNMFGRGIFRAMWKGRGGGQELSAEVMRAPV